MDWIITELKLSTLLLCVSKMVDYNVWVIWEKIWKVMWQRLIDTG